MARLFGLIFLCFLALVARADLSLVQTVRMNVGEGATPVQQLTIYHRGQKTRYDIGDLLTVIIDIDAKTRTSLDRQKKTFSTAPYAMLVAPRPPGPISVTTTERRTTIAGHPARLYRWKTTMGDIQANGEIWYAEDVPRAEFPAITGGLDTSAQIKEMSGHPLRVRLVTEVKRGTRVTLTSEVAGLSTREIPDSVFAIPAGFTEALKPEKSEKK